MRTISLEELLEAGCHFGHQVTRQNPKARDYIFEARDNIHIIDLEKTKEGLDTALQFVHDLAKKGGKLVILGAKRQAQGIVREELARAQKEGVDGIYAVTNRWIGGILTNFPEVSKNFKRLKQLTDQLQDEMEKAKYTKKEISLWEKERAKLASFYSGIADLTEKPDALFIIDTHLENLAVREAIVTRVKTVGMTDTNADPTMVDYAIPANDDAVGSIQLITSTVIDAWIEGRKAAKGEEAKAAKSAEQAAKKEAVSAEQPAAVSEQKEEKKKIAKKPVKEKPRLAGDESKRAVKTVKKKIEETKETEKTVGVE